MWKIVIVANTFVNICEHKYHINIQTGYFNEYLIITSENAGFYAGIASYCEISKLWVNHIGKLQHIIVMTRQATLRHVFATIVAVEKQ